MDIFSNVQFLIFAVALLTFVSIVCIGAMFLTGGRSQRQALESRLSDPKSRANKRQNEQESTLLQASHRFGRAISPKGMSEDLVKRMVRAGFHGKNTAAVYLGVKMFLLIIGFVGFALVAALLSIDFPVNILVVLGGSAVTFFMPNLYLSFVTGQRSAELKRHLPDAIDLLEICVSGGMGLDTAWNSVTDEVRAVCPILADEMTLTNLEKHLGADRGTAMRHMAERTGVEELSSLVAVLVQSDRFGTSVSEALRIFTQTLREMRSNKAEEKAEEMAVKMIVPMVVFIFPVVLIVAVGPAAIILSEIL